MIDVTQDIHSLTTFKRNSSGLMKQMKKTGRPLVLTVKGKVEAVLLDAAAYQEVASQLDAVTSIRRGLAQARKGAGRPAEEVFDELEREDAGRCLIASSLLPQSRTISGRPIAISAPRRLARRATGSGALARARKVWRATPSVVLWLPRARHLISPFANCSSAQASAVPIVFCLLFLRRKNRSISCTFGMDPCPL